jgi:hypothetical protein
MSTLQHTLQPAFRNRLALVVLLAAAMAALTVTLIIANGGSSSGSGGAVVQPSQAAIQRQLEAVSGPRYGIKPPQATSARAKHLSPQEQLEAVAGPRYGQQAWMLRQR